MTMHNRRWTVPARDYTPEALAEALAEHTWCACNGFRCGTMLWLNDSTGPDGAQEYAVVRESDLVQIESITVSWCTRDEITDYARRYASGDPGAGMFARLAPRNLQHPAGSCYACA